MKQIDKETLTYRPIIDYDIVLSQSIKDKVHVSQNLVATKIDEANENTETHKTDVLKEYEDNNPAIVLQKVSEALAIKEELDNILKDVEHIQRDTGISFNDDSYEYDINHPVIHDTATMIEVISDEIGDITGLILDLFDVENTDVGMSKRLGMEYDKINDVIAKEKAQITFYTDYQLSDVERAYVDEMIVDNRNPVQTYDDYIKQIIEEYRERGAEGVDYVALRDDTKKSYMAKYCLDSIVNASKIITNTHNFTMNDLFDDKVQDALVYLVDNANRQQVKSMSELNYRKSTRDANVIKDNMARHNDASFRRRLNEHVIEMDALKKQYMYVTEQTSLEDNQTSLTFASLNNSTKSLVDSNWENVLIDRMSSTHTLEHQLMLLNKSAMEQKEFSLMYRFSDLIDREFDFKHKDKELGVFNSRHRVYSMQ